jgi:flavin reductase (DIM6/NTAB) family NADH-FMN oxidoreductase RutF
MFGVTRVLSKSVPCLVAAECSAATDCRFFSLVSLMCSKIVMDM